MATNSTTTPSTDEETDLGGSGESVQLDSLRKEYGDVVAVDDLSLTIESGEFLVLLGPSGCGKSTTLRMVAGLETPTAGEIYIGDDSVTRMLPQKRDLSMVFQSYALYPHKTVRGNLAFPLGKMDIEDGTKDDRIHRTAELLEIDDLLDKEPGQLSGGQRQRVALGRTIIREPRAFLMDEPLSNLDAKLRVQTRAEIRELQQDLGTTTVYVTHDQEEAMSLADRIAIMNDGKLQQVGTPAEVYQNPANEFVAGFVGEPAMNFFDVDVSAGDPHIFPSDPVMIDRCLPDSTVTFGVRPENVHLVNSADGNVDSPSAPFECDVAIIEPLGNAYELELERGDCTFTVRVRTLDNSTAATETVDVVFDLDMIHAFDEAGSALRTGGETDG
jgi:multiple sugar transport system ATP-binding protein